MAIIIAVLNISFLAFISYQLWRKARAPLKQFFWPALLIKLAAGIGMGLIYTYFYTVGDTFNYFKDGVELANLAKVDFGEYARFLWSGDHSFSVWRELIFNQPRAVFLSKITSVFCLLTANNYWIISLYFSALAFGCSWLLVTKIISWYKPFAFAAIISFLFFPSVVFWSSGVIKESIAMAALFFLSYVFLKMWMGEKVAVIKWLLALLSLWLLWNLKYYYVAVFLPVICTTLVVRLVLSRYRLNHTLLKILVWLLIFIMPLSLVSLLHPNFYPGRILDVVVSSYYEFKAISPPGDIIHYAALEATPISFLKHTPLALFSGLFRPLLTEAKTFFQFFIAFENLILLILSLTAMTRLGKLLNHEHRLVIFSISVYIFLLCVFLALSAPNFGTLVRYRVGFLPFLVFVLTIENPLINKLMTLKTFRDLVR